MKTKIALLIVSIAALGVIFLWSSRVDPFSLSTHQFHPSETRAPEATPRVDPAPTVTAKPVRVIPLRQQPEAVVAPPAAVVENVSAPDIPARPPARPPAPPVQAPPFPMVDQIVAGAAENSVIEKYGAPAISTLTSRGGHVVGTYVYAKDQGRSETVIHLEDGKVSSVVSKSAPPSPKGIPAPRLWRNE